MLPYFYKGVRVHINTDIDEFKIGHIVVYHNKDKFTAHRIVNYDSQSDLYTTKGDTLFYFDSPRKKENFLGLVDRVEKRGKSYSVNTNPTIARLSSHLGNRLKTTLDWLPDWLKFLYYFSIYMPDAIVINLKKKASTKKDKT